MSLLLQSFAKPVVYLLLALISVVLVFCFLRTQQVTEILKQTVSTRAGLIAAVLARLVFGLSLLGVAADSRYPATLKIIALILVGSAFMVAVLGSDRIVGIIRWFELRGPLFMKFWLALGLIFVVFILFALR